MKAIINFFAREHLLGNLLTILLLLFGTFSIYTINRDLYPEVNFEMTSVVTALPGGSPAQIEKLIVNPVEEALRGVEGIKKIFSTATEGVGVTIIQLDIDGRASDKTNDDIKQAIESMNTLPDDAEDPLVKEIEASQMPIITLTVAGDADEDRLRAAAKYVYDELIDLKEVSKVNKNGYRDQEIWIETDPQKMSNRNVGLNDIVKSINLQNVSLPSGTTLNQDRQELLIKTDSEYYNDPSNSEVLLKQIKDTVLKANDAGFATTINDVATVAYKLQKPVRAYKAGGKNAIHLVIFKKENSDVLTLVENVRAKAEELQSKLGTTFQLGFAKDHSKFVKNRIGVLTSNLLLGLLLVLIVLSIFLPWQVTIIVAVGIPIALLSAIGAIYMGGFTINLISLIGLILVLGMLVDDAIVVSENIWRHIESGDNMHEAVVNGTSEVFGPVIASVLTTVSAFAPMLFMSGIFGSFIHEIPLIVILALFFSLFEAFIIMPSHFVSWVGPFAQDILKKIKAKKEKKKGFIDKLIHTYQKYVFWSINNRYKILTFIVALAIGTGALLKVGGRFVLFPPDGIEFFFVHIEAHKETSIEEMANLIQPIEDSIAQMDPLELESQISTIGIIQQDPNDPQTRRGSHYANIQVTLTPNTKRARGADEIAKELRDKLTVPKGIISVKTELIKPGPPQGRTISINLMGDDFKVLNSKSHLLVDKLKSIDGVIDIKHSYAFGKDEWLIKPDSKEMAMLNINAAMVSSSVRAAFEGLIASSIRDLDDEINIRVKMVDQPSKILNKLKNIKIENPLGNLIPLDQIATFKKQKTVNAITHKNFKRVINVSADVDLNLITGAEVNALAEPFVKEMIDKINIQGQKSYKYEMGGEKEDTDDSMKSLGVAFLFAAIFIFFLLVVTFRSLVQPFVILGSIPMGFMGVVYAMILHNRPFSFMAILGVIALAGIIVNNAIVLTDFVNVLRSKGKKLNESIVEAAGVRLRPILLTTTTTICGLLPTAYGETVQKLTGLGGSDPFIIPIALALGWGIAFGSIMTGLFFPALIRISDDIRRLRD
ncbi:MAG: efflux RND transporter permease subunit [Bdellovibrionaceae bacterium]|jgi:multidrug efflux pump subunit AcrB|nr:efflux RND transporter permease subunit [Pseudobdellovibrionaceae bacterium]